MKLNYHSLKTRHRNERGDYHINLSLRVHRALSWLSKAEEFNDDLDSQFIFLWISFNAAYANEFDSSRLLTEQKMFGDFLNRLCKLDEKNLLYELVWSEFTGSIRMLLDNKYIFKPFWEYKNGKITEEECEAKLNKAKSDTNRALSDKNTPLILAIIFSRLYTLRNQVLHGGATWNSTINRDQIRDGTNLLAKVVPAIITIMMNNSNKLWGDPCYPVVD
jgi:hypothetical protein